MIEKLNNFKQTDAFELPEWTLGCLLWQACSLWRAEVNSLLRASGLTHQQFILLSAMASLAKSGRQITQKQLSIYCFIDAVTTSQSLRIMEKKGLVMREAIGYDGRGRYPAITENGVFLLSKTLDKIAVFDKNFFSNLKNCDEFTSELKALGHGWLS